MAASPQPSIANPNIWMMTLDYLITSISQDHKLLDRIPTLIAINIIKHVLREINTLPADLTTTQVNCLNKGKELVNLLLLGSNGDGAGAVSHYDIIVAVSINLKKLLFAKYSCSCLMFMVNFNTVLLRKVCTGLWKSLSTSWANDVDI